MNTNLPDNHKPFPEVSLKLIGKNKWETLEPIPFSIVSPFYKSGYVPSGFNTDMASIPRLFWSVLPTYGKYAKSAIIHDYALKILSRNKADMIFKTSLKRDNVRPLVITVLYLGVRLRTKYLKLKNSL